MGIPTLISTHTADGDSELDITSNITSAYDEYMFVCTDINPATDSVHFQFQVNAAGGADFNETITSTAFISQHAEDGSGSQLAYQTADDQAEGTAFQRLIKNIGNGSDESCAGILHLFSPASTTYIKHFYARFSGQEASNYMEEIYTAGYINTTAAIDEISFKSSSGDFDGVIQMYGIK